jgi:hypothetical protein
VRAEGGRSTALAVGTLVALACALYALPAAFGHPVVPGDDLTQNLPLRELVGTQLAHGHLPLFDPYIWSGAPLLAGWNAGAAYPLTWLFAVLPGDAAWSVNLAAAAGVAGVGCFAFLRASGLGAVASWLGGLTYAFGGAMAAQVTHIGLYIGMSWVPVALLATNRLTRRRDVAGADLGRNVAGDRASPRRSADATWPWCAVLGASVGLAALSGEPRAVTNAAVVLVIYALWRVWPLLRVARVDRLHGGRAAARRAATAVVVGWVLGAGLAAVQLVPGLEAVAVSQRSSGAAYLFGAGSLPVRWLLLLGVPDLLGGSGTLGQPTFFASYSLTEVTSDVGVLSLVAAFALAGRALGARRRGEGSEWAVWYVVGAAGVLLALGSHTPLWHLFVHLPLLGGQRLQSRSILVTDLALAVLLAYWADGWLRRAGPPATAERLAGTIPAVAVVALVVAGMSEGPALAEWMGVSARTAQRAVPLGPWLAPFLALALGAVALLWWGARAGPRARPVLVVTLVVADLVVFALTSVVALDAQGRAASGGDAARRAGAASAAGATARAGPRSRRVRPIAALHLKGRVAVYDPGLLHGDELKALGVPDANVNAGTYSVEGYGSIVDGPYARATGVHGLSGEGQDVFAPGAASDGVLDSLDTTDVLAPPAYFGRVVAGRARGAAASRGVPGVRDVARGRSTTWFFGTSRTVTSADVPVAGTAAVRGLRLGLLGARGHVRWSAATAAAGGLVRATWGGPTTAVGLTASWAGGRATVLLGAPDVVDGGAGFLLDGVLQRAITAPHFAYAGHDGAFGIFDDRRAAPPLRLRQPRAAAGAAGAAVVRRLSGPPLEPTSAEVDSAHGAEVVRAVAAGPGWHASWRAAGAAAAAPLPVRRLGVVQAVEVPAGRGVLTWTYDAPGFLAGAWISAGAALALLGLATLARSGRRRRARPGGAGDVPTPP